MDQSAGILNARILIVDDQNFNILLLERTLKTEGYLSVSSTNDPATLCALQHQFHYDLIMLDIDMPGMDSYAVIEGLKKPVADDHPQVLVITSEPGRKEHALQAGAKDFVSKPFESVEVLTRVHNLLEIHLLQKEIADREAFNPAISNVIQRNIRKINHLRQRAENEQCVPDRIANAITQFSGSMVFFYLHIGWFSLWFILNTGQLGLTPFDPYPYNFLTQVVSLEAIFLATFVLISQNLFARKAERLSDLSLQTALLTLHELTHVLQMLRAIQQKTGISRDPGNPADADLLMESKLEDVLTEIDRLQKREADVSKNNSKFKYYLKQKFKRLT